MPINLNYLDIFIAIILLYRNTVSSHQNGIQSQANHKSNVENKYETEAPVENITFLDEVDKLSREYYSLFPLKLTALAELEQDVYSVLLDCNKTQSYELKANKTLAEEVHVYLLDYKDGTRLEAESSGPFDKKTRAYKIASNPLITYRMLRRFSVHISNINSYLTTALLSCKWCTKLKDVLRGLKRLPTIDDERDAVDSILRIQDYYNLSSFELSKGIFGSINTTGKLTVINAIEIGLFAKEIHNFVLALEWLELGRVLLMYMVKSFPGQEEYIDEINEYISQAKTEHDEFWDKSDLEIHGLFFFKNKFSDLSGNYIERKRIEKIRFADYAAAKHLENLVVKPEAYEHRNTAMTDLRYRALCAGANYQTAKEKRQLRCWYETKQHPYWRINPLKLELLHPDPPLLQVYDMLGDEFIDEIMAEAAPSLQVAETVNLAIRKSEVNDYRTAVNAWIDDRSSIHMKSFYKKLRFFTGLIVDREGASEHLQVAGYSFGGHYATHIDCLADPSLIYEDGDRIATFMAYMNDVPFGGSTAFPYMGTAATPVKGSAVFWYGMLKNGTCDERAVHGACPVVLGDKYVFNIWIRAFQNFQNRPCSLNKNE